MPPSSTRPFRGTSAKTMIFLLPTNRHSQHTLSLSGADNTSFRDHPCHLCLWTHHKPIPYRVAGAKCGRATTTLVESHRVTTPLIVSWTYMLDRCY